MAKHGLWEPVLCHDRYNIARILSRFLTFKTIATKLDLIEFSFLSRFFIALVVVAVID
jgi:hypothetical protein